MKKIRTIYEKRHCIHCKKEVNHTVFEFNDGRSLIECLGCGEVEILGPTPVEVKP